MDGPHVFTFDERGMVVLPGTAKAAVAVGHPGCIGTPSPVFSKPWSAPAVRSTPESSSSTSSTATFTSSPSSTTASSSAEELSRIRKPWKLATLTEQDDAEFEELMARIAAESLLQHVPLTAYADASFSIAPTSKTANAIVEENKYAVLDQFSAEAGSPRPHNDEDAASNSEIENKVPTTPPLWTMSPSSTSAASHSDESFVVPTPHQRGERIPFTVLHEHAPSPCADKEAELRVEQEEEVALEKVVVGVERLRKKAPSPLRLECEEAEVERNCVLFQGDAGGDIGEGTPVCTEVLSPLTAGFPVRPGDLPL